MYRKNNWNGTFYLSETFSSYVSSGYPVWLTGYTKDRNGTELFSAQGSAGVSSMTAVFSLDPSHTDVEPGDHQHYEVQFRDSENAVIANAVVGVLRMKPTLKL